MVQIKTRRQVNSIEFLFTFVVLVLLSLVFCRVTCYFSCDPTRARSSTLFSVPQCPSSYSRIKVKLRENRPCRYNVFLILWCSSREVNLASAASCFSSSRHSQIQSSLAECRWNFQVRFHFCCDVDFAEKGLFSLSMFPLLYKDGLLLPYIAVAFAYIIFYIWSEENFSLTNHWKQTVRKNPSSFVLFLHLIVVILMQLSLFGMCAIHAINFSLTPPAK